MLKYQAAFPHTQPDVHPHRIPPLLFTWVY